MKNKSPHLLFIVNSLRFGGAEKHVVSLLNNLDRKKFVFSLACLTDDNSLLPQINISRLKSIFTCNVAHKIDLNSIDLIADYIDKQHVDLVICTNQYPMLYGLLASRKATYPCQVVEIFHSTLFNNFKARLQWILYRQLFKLCKHVVFVSEKQKTFWLHEAGMKVQSSCVIHNGINVTFFNSYKDEKKESVLRSQYGILHGDFVVGICAVLRPEKKHGDLIESIARVREKGINAKLCIIGDGPDKKKIEDLIANRNLENSAFITGFQNDVRPYIALCDCLVISSHSVETFSIAALEAMAMARPLIMSDIGGASEQIIHGLNGYLYEKGNIASLTKYIELLSDQSKRKEMGKVALEKVKSEFTLEKMTREYEDLFINL